MRLDHISYAAGPEGLAACVQRLGAALGAGFTDGGLHPRFGTRNFVLALSSGIYLEVVAALDHPAAEKAPFGRAVRARSEAGGGWLSWAVGVTDLDQIEDRLGRGAADGHRVRPDGYDLTWRQIGINDSAADPQLPWFIHWTSPKAQHPGSGGGAVRIARIDIAGDSERVSTFLGGAAAAALKSMNVSWLPASERDSGIVAVIFDTTHGRVTIT